jgi:RHS repeat-associated protein
LRADGACAAANPFRFSTKHEDEAGLLYYGYRYYDPETGRWARRDPIGEKGGVGLRIFALNDPISYVDRSGLDNFGGHPDYSGSLQNRTGFASVSVPGFVPEPPPGPNPFAGGTGRRLYVGTTGFWDLLLNAVDQYDAIELRGPALQSLKDEVRDMVEQRLEERVGDWLARERCLYAGGLEGRELTVPIEISGWEHGAHAFGGKLRDFGFTRRNFWTVGIVKDYYIAMEANLAVSWHWNEPFTLRRDAVTNPRCGYSFAGTVHGFAFLSDEFDFHPDKAWTASLTSFVYNLAAVLAHIPLYEVAGFSEPDVIAGWRDEWFFRHFIPD